MTPTKLAQIREALKSAAEGMESAAERSESRGAQRFLIPIIQKTREALALLDTEPEAPAGNVDDRRLREMLRRTKLALARVTMDSDPNLGEAESTLADAIAFLDAKPPTTAPESEEGWPSYKEFIHWWNKEFSSEDLGDEKFHELYDYLSAKHEEALRADSARRGK